MKTTILLALVSLLGAATLRSQSSDASVDFDKARQLFEKHQSGGTLTADEEAYIERARAAHDAQMKKQGGGVIINVGSVALRLGMPNLTHYLASKGGLVGLTRGLARDLGAHGIRVNCLHLGAILTEGELRLFPDQAAILKSLEEKQSLPGRLTPESIEPTFAFFASDDSSDITGQCLTIDRGWVHD